MATQALGVLSAHLPDIIAVGNRMVDVAVAVGSVAAKLGPFLPLIATAVALFVAWRTAMTIGVAIEGVVVMVQAFAGTLAILSAAEGEATIAQWLLNIAMDANPIGAVVLGIMVLVGAIVLLITHWTQVRQWIVNVSGSIAHLIEAHKGLAIAIMILGGPITLLIGLGALLVTHWSQVSTWARRIGQEIVSLVAHHKMLAIAIATLLTGPIVLLIAAAVLIVTHWRQLVAFFAGLPADIGGAFAALGSAVHGALRGIGGAFSALGGTIHSALAKVVAVAESAWSEFSRRPFFWIGRVVAFVPATLALLIVALIVWSAKMIAEANRWANAMVNSALTMALNFVVAVGTELLNLPGQVKDWLAQVLPEIASWGLSALQAGISAAVGFVVAVGSELILLPGQVWTLLSQVIEGVARWASDMVPRGVQAAADFTLAVGTELLKLPGQVGGIGVSIAQGIIGGLKSMIGSAIHAAQDFINGMIQGAKDAAGSHSPAAAFVPLGASIPEGVAVGIRQGSFTALGAMNSLVDGMVGGGPSGGGAAGAATTAPFAPAYQGLGAPSVAMDDTNELLSALYHLLDERLPRGGSAAFSTRAYGPA